ncbi:ABC transporter ATP-binding protein [Citricoccus sp. NPDC055426]|uniref:ABC transporter ATP-binding protein n=1 Tax=Citricoccus sp. NPDC055426 TaxID=3155536 RepID=UPI00344863B7
MSLSTESNVGQSPAHAAGTPERLPEAGVSVRSLTKSFRRRSGEIVHAIDNVDLDVHPGELLVLLGPSGCGKTTLMRCIAGLETPDSGHIRISGDSVFDDTSKLDRPANSRAASMVFQSYALWPHMTVQANVAYPLQNRRMSRKDVRESVSNILEAVGVSNLAGQYPAQLSGGQQQRVSLARAIVAGNDVILFDEPLSNVDAKVRDKLRLELIQMQHRLGYTAIYVTHDQEEAMTLGDRIAVLEEGRIAQLGTPREIYTNPASYYVANFIGAANEFKADLLDSAEGPVRVKAPFGELTGRTVQEFAGSEVRVLIRPESIHRVPGDAPAAENQFKGVVEDIAFVGGGRIEYIVNSGGVLLRAWAQVSRSVEVQVGDDVLLEVEPGDVLVFEGAL